MKYAGLEITAEKTQQASWSLIKERAVLVVIGGVLIAGEKKK